MDSFLYHTAYHPDFMFVICLCAHFQAHLKESYLNIVKNIMRYLIDTQQMGIWYPMEAYYELVRFTDFGFDRFILDMESTSDMCHLLGNLLISYNSKEQESFVLPTVEAEYVVACSCCS